MSLEQAKRRDKKVYITDVAISKVPCIKYHGFSEKMNEIMQELAKTVLLIAKDENDSNEVAVTCDLGLDDPLEQFGIALGTEHEVNIMSDTYSNHLIVSQESIAVVVLHNHPSTQTFSLQDIQVFLSYPKIEVMTVISNQGTVHYLMREASYDYKAAFKLFRDCVEELTKESSIKEQYLASLSFLAKSSEVGIYYR